MTEDDIANLFSSFGHIKSIKVKMPQSAQTEEGRILQESNLSVLHGMAYVDFETEEQASKAI